MRDPAKNPWIERGVTISRRVLDAVDAEARAAYARDEESCGLLAGPAASAAGEAALSDADGALLCDEVVPLENRANKLHALDPMAYPRTARMYFDVDPLKFAREIARRAAAGRPAKVLYHSHLDVGAYFSETDAAAANAGGDAPAYDLAYLVTSVRAQGVDDRKLFVWDPMTRAFVEAPLVVREDGRSGERDDAGGSDRVR